MKETDRIVSLFEKLYSGEPWIDVTIQGTLSQISSDQAFQRPIPNCNTIWEVDSSEQAWNQTLKRLETVHNEWIEYLKQVDSESFESIYPPNQMTFYEHISGILQHDAYHLGQIVLLAKQV